MTKYHKLNKYLKVLMNLSHKTTQYKIKYKTITVFQTILLFLLFNINHINLSLKFQQFHRKSIKNNNLLISIAQLIYDNINYYIQFFKINNSNIVRMSFEKFEVFGNSPLPRFGHSITYYAKNKVCLFGGATGTTGQFSITDNTYTLDLATKFWKKIDTTGTTPSPRAAHGAVCIENNKIVIYGGATGSGGLASDDLYLLDIKDGVGIWNTINVVGKTPGRRYGHTLSYSKPYLVVFGGNIGEKSVNDCWILLNDKAPLSWAQVKCQGEVPPARVYHSAALCTAGTAAGMIVIFGGRSTENNPLNDSWGLRRHRKGHWDWVRAPQKSSPSARYQHSSLFLGSLMIIVGGRTNNVSQTLPLQVFDTEASQWTSFSSVQRFRHGSWIFEKHVYIYGGFELSTPNIPTDAIYKANLQSLFKNNKGLLEKLNSLQPDLNSSTSSINSVTSNNSTRNTQLNRSGPNTPTISGNSELKQRKMIMQQEHSHNSKSRSQRKKRVVVLQPVIGKNQDKLKSTMMEPKKALGTKQDLPHFFLNTLLKPKEFMNSQALNIHFKPQHIIALCDLAQQIIADQPMVLQAKTPLKIFGDIHGQFSDLMSFFHLYGTPHENGKKKDIENYDYIFLGDFVDRGYHSLQTICLLLALKIVYPQQIHLIRGNHEDSQINSTFGFSDECAEKLDQDPVDQNSVFKRMNRLFDWLPLAATVQDQILCLHGGIGACVKTIESIQNIKRPLQIMHQVQDQQSQLVLDILWSDPADTDNDIGIFPNHLRDPQGAGNIVKFGPDRVQQFLNKNKLSMIIRAHECVMDGFQRFAGGKLITVFSATGSQSNFSAHSSLKPNVLFI